MQTRVHSFESFGTVDGPGIRFVVFLQGCPLRCKYCHNPDTWEYGQGKTMDNEQIVEEILKYRNYFKDNGGVTFSGGEPLVQIDCVIDLCRRLKQYDIHTCIDTSGTLFQEDQPEILEKYKALLEVCDLFLLDIKHIREQEHIDLTGRSNQPTLAFAKFLSDHHKPMWIRHVLVPNVTSQPKALYELKQFLSTLDNVEKIEVLPYHTMGIVKYKNLGIEYPFAQIERPSKEMIATANQILKGDC